MSSIIPPLNGLECNKVFMSNVHFSLREDDLHQFFEGYKLKIVKMHLLKNEKGQSKGSGFVEFETLQDAI